MIQDNSVYNNETAIYKESLATRGFARHGLILYDGEEVQSMMERAGFRNVQAVLSSDQHRGFLCMSGQKGPVPV
jgi:hypothetical protein